MAMELCSKLMVKWPGHPEQICLYFVLGIDKLKVRA